MLLLVSHLSQGVRLTAAIRNSEQNLSHSEVPAVALNPYTMQLAKSVQASLPQPSEQHSLLHAAGRCCISHLVTLDCYRRPRRRAVASFLEPASPPSGRIVPTGLPGRHALHWMECCCNTILAADTPAHSILHQREVLRGGAADLF